MTFTIGFISGIVFMLLVIQLINYSVKYSINKGEELSNVADKLMEDKIKLQNKLNELING